MIVQFFIGIKDNSYIIKYFQCKLFQFQEKLDELEKLKMAHLSKFVEKSRQELRALWDKCYYGQEQRKAFVPMTLTDYDEEMLDEHEKEVERMKGFLDENAAIFRMV